MFEVTRFPLDPLRRLDSPEAKPIRCEALTRNQARAVEQLFKALGRLEHLSEVGRAIEIGDSAAEVRQLQRLLGLKAVPDRVLLGAMKDAWAIAFEEGEHNPYREPIRAFADR